MMDEAVLTAYTDAAKELNLPREAAQSIVDKIAPLMVQRQQEAMTAMSQEWQAQSRIDPEFGGDKLAVGNIDVATLADAPRLRIERVEQIGSDLLIEAHPRKEA